MLVDIILPSQEEYIIWGKNKKNDIIREEKVNMMTLLIGLSVLEISLYINQSGKVRVSSNYSNCNIVVLFEFVLEMTQDLDLALLCLAKCLAKCLVIHSEPDRTSWFRLHRREVEEVTWSEDCIPKL